MVLDYKRGCGTPGEHHHRQRERHVRVQRSRPAHEPDGGAGRSDLRLWDVNQALPAILEDGDGNRYVYGLDLIARIDSSDDEEYYLYDGLGSTRALADDGGDVPATYSSHALGN